MRTRKLLRRRRNSRRPPPLSRRARRGGAEVPSVGTVISAQEASINKPTDPDTYPVFKPGPGQFGYKDPSAINYTGSFTEYKMGIPGFGMRGYTNPGESIFKVRQLGPTGILQDVSMGASLLIPGVALAINGMAGPPPQSTLPFDPSLAPPDYYGALGLINNHTPLSATVVADAYYARKNTGTNAQKKLFQDAYSTLSDPAKRYTYDYSVNQYYTQHPPSIAQLVETSRQIPMSVGKQQGPFPPGFNPLETAIKTMSWLPGLGSILQAPIQIQR